MLKYFVILLFVISCSPEDQHQHDVYYTCSMHPEVREKEPGKCPICHMNLTKVVSEDDAIDSEVPKSEVKKTWQCKDYPDVTSDKEDICPIDGTAMILKDDAVDVIAKVKLRKSQLKHFRPSFFSVTMMEMKKSVRLLGTVIESEEKESNIPARVRGRVEKVYVKSTGSLINVGDPVVDLYAPKLITAGEEYLLARKSFKKSPEFKELVKQSEERLLLWGIKRGQFESWYKKNKVPRLITIYSPVTGVVTSKNAIVGKYFKEGENFFKLSDLGSVWIEMDVYEHDAHLVKIDQQVEFEFTSLPGNIFKGKIDFINPVFDAKSHTLKVRATITNSKGILKPGMVAQATLHLHIVGKRLVVPRSAIIDTGKRKVVWIKINERKFEARLVTTGIESQGYVEIVNGLQQGDSVVIEANFLLDAQAQLFGGYE